MIFFCHIELILSRITKCKLNIKFEGIAFCHVYHFAKQGLVVVVDIIRDYFLNGEGDYAFGLPMVDGFVGHMIWG